MDRIEEIPEVENKPQIPQGTVDGELLIKFSPEMSEILDRISDSSNQSMTRSGIPSTDEVLEILGTYRFERVFPIDKNNEELPVKQAYIYGTRSVSTPIRTWKKQ